MGHKYLDREFATREPSSGWREKTERRGEILFSGPEQSSLKKEN